MKVRVLGCSGGVGGAARTTSLLVDQDILVDCGTGAGELSLEALLRIDHVFLTHSHLDHIALLPMLVDTVGNLRERPITVHAPDETLRILRAHIFNWLVWPDFTAIPDRNSPILRMQPLQAGELVRLGERCVQALPALHSVPAVGYCLHCGGDQLAFSGDTAVCDQQIAALNALERLRYLLIETAFPNEHQDLALAARHLSPNMLHTVLDRLTGRPEVYVTHFKPGYTTGLTQELTNCKSRLPPQVLLNGHCFDL
jgi:ribonuclease BN (tRNA processing enzyme)